MVRRLLLIVLAVVAAAAVSSMGASGATGSDAAPTSDATALSSTPFQTVVSLTFDDGLASQVDAASALAAHGLHGTFYVNSSTINTTGFLTLPQLTAIAAGGNEIGGHSTYHYDIPDQDTLDEQRREICGDRNWLLSNGFSPVSYAYPYSHWSADTEAIVAQCGYTSARQGWMFDSTTCQSAGTACAETIPPADPMAIRTGEQVMTTMTPADLEQQVTAAEATGGGWVPIELHNVCSDCGDYAITTADFNTFLDWLVAQQSQGVSVQTVAQVMGNPPVAGPGPYPTAPAPNPQNMLQNPGLEDVGPGWILPYQVPVRCWQEWGNWSVPATWTRTSDAHSGSYAMNIQLSGTDTYGYHAMVPTLDLGACAPPASPGQVFTFTGWYKSDTPVNAFQLVRGAAKVWRVLDGTKTLPPASTWTQFTYTLPAMPSDATGVAPGFQFTNNGSFTVDDLSLTVGGAAPTSTLTVTPAGTGTGTVTSNPAAISCGTTCSAPFAQGSTVTLTATPTAGSTFTGWSGACTGTGTCTVTMSAAASVTATFGLAAPAAPSALAAVAGSSSGISLAWTDNASNETGYTLQRSTTSSFTTVTSFTLPAGTTSYNDSGLTASTTYYYRVEATNAAGSSAFSNTASATTQAAPASTLTVTPAGTGTGTVTSSPVGITCGTTCSAPFAQGSSVTLTATPATGSTFTGWSGACTGTSTCKVTMGTAAVAVTATFGVAAPAAPSALAAVAGSASAISLTWTDNSSNETGFTLQRSTTSSFTTVTSFTLPAGTTSYGDTGLTASTTYYYRVEATNATGSSAFSNTASAKTQAPAPPAAPSSLAAVAGSSSTMSLTWTDNASNETGFTLQRSTSSSFRSVTSFSLAANTTSYSDTGLAASTTYYYRVEATNATGSSAFSNTASAKTQAPALPAAPSGLAAVAGSTSAISLTWTDNASNETGFTLQRSTSSSFTTVTSFSLAANATSYSDTGLAASTTYYYRVRASNATGSSAYSNTANAKTQAPAVPAAPSGLAAVAGSSSAISLTWTDNASNETGFTLQRSTSSTFTTVTSFTLAANATSYSDSGLTASTAYYYRVEATNATGSSAFSNTASATTSAVATAPAAPSGLAAVAGSSSAISLTWTDNASNETGFTLQRSTSSTFTTVTSFSLPANTTSYADSGLATSTAYYYRVEATNATGSSAFSNTASATTSAVATAPAAPSALAAAAGSSSAISLTWTDNASNETGFTLQRSTTSTFTTVTSFSLPANTTSYSDSGLAASTAYYYRVQATNATGSSAFSNTATATTQALTAAGYAPAVLADNPISYWRLGETSGITAGDQMNLNPGTYYNGVTLNVASLLVGDPANAAATFDGVNDFINVFNSTSLGLTTAVTLEAWIKPASLPAAGSLGSIVSKLGSYSLQLDGPQLEFALTQGGTTHKLDAASGAIQVGSVYHVVGTYDGTTERLYINGVQVTSAALTGAISTSSNSLTIGSGGGAGYFAGTIDDVAVYGTALSAARVASHYTAGT